MSGKVYIVGAGPGRKDLISVRGANILKSSDVVIYDYLVDKAVLEYVGEDTELICAGKLVGKGRYSKGDRPLVKKIMEVLLDKVREGKRVTRLKNGDPCIFGRLNEELAFLTQHNVEFEIVPGITAGIAAGAYTGISLTDRDVASTCVFVTGHLAEGKDREDIDWRILAKIDTLVVYMGIGNIIEIIDGLINAGKNIDTPVAVIKDATLISQKLVITSLGRLSEDIKKHNIIAPAVLIIGEVVRKERVFNWWRKNKKIIFTGLSTERFFLKGNYYHFPTIEIKPLKSYSRMDMYIKKISIFDWIVFTSRFGVEYFFQRLKFLGYDARYLAGINIAAIGMSTAYRLEEFGIKADLIPKKESSQGLVEEFKRLFNNDNGKRIKIFMPRSNLADKGLKEKLTGLGIDVISCVAYRNVARKDLADIDFQSFDEIVFTAPSVVRSFKKRYGVIKGIGVRSIGDVTYKAVLKEWEQ